MKTRLRRSERDAIRTDYGERMGYLALAAPAKELERKMKTLRLSPEELFMECLSVLDKVKEDPDKASFNLQSLWDDLYCDFREVSDEGVSEEELNLATAEVVYSVILCLTPCGKSTYSELTFQLMLQLEDHYPSVDDLEGRFMQNAERLGVEDFKHAVEEYMEREDCFLSDEIAGKLKGMSKETVAEPLQSTASSLRITDGKLTSLLVVLTTMYQSHWFVKTDGSAVTNRDKTIAEILERAFDLKEVNIKQLLSTARCRNKSDLEDYFQELLEKVKS